MFKLLVLSCLLVSCLADPFGLPSWLREAGRQHRHPRGCANRAEGWRACARLNSSDSLAPHGHDCSLFFYCSGGVRPACRKCPAGLHFNPQLQVCDWPENVDCVSRPPDPHHNVTMPYPTTPENDATVTVIDGSTTTDGITTDETTTGGTSTDDTTTDETTTDGATTDGARTDGAATDGAATDGITTDGTTITDAATTHATSTEPSFFSWQNYIPWGRQ